MKILTDGGFMKLNNIPENPYLLLTPGPLSTSKRVKSVMLRDWCTWDDDYNSIVQDIRSRLTKLASIAAGKYTSILMQGSGTFSVEAVLGSVIPDDGKLLVIANGAYGLRIHRIASMLKIDCVLIQADETSLPDLNEIEETLKIDCDITHIAVVHVETTTGIINPVKEIGALAEKYNKNYIVDAMSSFGGIELDMNDYKIDYLVSSSNKCLQGVPGFGFIIADKEKLRQTKGFSRSHSLDVYDQWETMELNNGKWRFTSPTHVVRAFHEALLELDKEGGIHERNSRYLLNQKTLVSGMRELGFSTLLPDKLHSPIITSFLSPESDKYSFRKFYEELKKNGYVIYPGKITERDTFRIGNIGNVYQHDINELLRVIEEIIYWE